MSTTIFRRYRGTTFPRSEAARRSCTIRWCSTPRGPGLLLKFVFDPGICLFSRQARTERGRVALNAEVKPDIEFLEGFEAAAPNELIGAGEGNRRNAGPFS